MRWRSCHIYVGFKGYFSVWAYASNMPIFIMNFNLNIPFGFILTKKSVLGISRGRINKKISELMGFMFFCRFWITSVIVHGQPNFIQNEIVWKNQISQKPTCNLKITQNYLMTMNIQKTKLKGRRKRKN